MVNINSLESDGFRQDKFCPRHTMMINTKNNLMPDRSQPGLYGASYLITGLKRYVHLLIFDYLYISILRFVRI